MKNESCLQLLKKLQMLSIDIGSKTISMNTLLNLSQEFVNKMLKFEDRSQFEVLFYVLRYDYDLDYMLKCADVVSG